MYPRGENIQVKWIMCVSIIIRQMVLQCDHQWKATLCKIVIINQYQLFSSLYLQWLADIYLFHVLESNLLWAVTVWSHYYKKLSMETMKCVQTFIIDKKMTACVQWHGISISIFHEIQQKLANCSSSFKLILPRSDANPLQKQWSRASPPASTHQS